MRMVVFAHTPPPLHGQSRMVQLLVENLRHATEATTNPAGDLAPAPADRPSELRPITGYHVNARLSADLADVGRARWGKVARLLCYCVQAVWFRIRHQAPLIYFVPAAPLRPSLYRDWLVMLCCRPFFRRVVFHWHAVGLGAWVDREAKPWERRISHALMNNVALALVLAESNRPDAERFHPQNIAVVANGLPDPCPEYDRVVAPQRAARLAARRQALARSAAEGAARGAPGIVRVLFMAHCTRDKGLFQAIAGVRLANQELVAQQRSLCLRLAVAGAFRDAADRTEFDRLLAAPGAAEWLEYLGFIDGETKERTLLETDLFCFPTTYHAESLGLVLLEAMAYGIPIVTTRWRSNPEILPPHYSGLLASPDPATIATTLLKSLDEDSSQLLRSHFLRHYTLQQHLAGLTAALRLLDNSVPMSAVARS